MAAPRRVIELAFEEKTLAELLAIARSRRSRVEQAGSLRASFPDPKLDEAA